MRFPHYCRDADDKSPLWKRIGPVAVPRGKRVTDGFSALLARKRGAEVWQTKKGIVTKLSNGEERVWPTDQDAYEYLSKFATASKTAAEQNLGGQKNECGQVPKHAASKRRRDWLLVLIQLVGAAAAFNLFNFRRPESGQYVEIGRLGSLRSGCIYRVYSKGITAHRVGMALRSSSGSLQPVFTCAYARPRLGRSRHRHGRCISGVCITKHIPRWAKRYQIGHRSSVVATSRSGFFSKKFFGNNAHLRRLSAGVGWGSKGGGQTSRDVHACQTARARVRLPRCSIRRKQTGTDGAPLAPTETGGAESSPVSVPVSVGDRKRRYQVETGRIGLDPKIRTIAQGSSSGLGFSGSSERD